MHTGTRLVPMQAQRDVQAAIADDPGLRMALALQAEDSGAESEQGSDAAVGDTAWRRGSVSLCRRGKSIQLKTAGSSYVADWKQR